MAAEEGGEFFDGEIISEILVRLPVKSLARFRCVSKSWGALISDPYFTKKHLSYLKKGITKNTSRLLYSLYHPASLDHEALKDLKDHSDASFANRELDFPAPVYPCQYRPRSIVGSCDGLVCIIDEDGGYFVLWNPCTRFFRKLHKTAGLPRICYPYLMKHTICGFGYDSATDDYKVILGDIGGGVAIVHVYALKTGSWKVVRIPIKPFTISGRGFFLNGALHWLSENTGSQQIILSFDLVKGKFYDMIPLPDGDISFGGMRVVRNRLCVFNHLASRRGVCTIWLMKEYGVKRSWTQVAKFSSKDFPEDYKNVFTMLPLCILEGGQVLLDTDHGEHLLVLYDPKEKTFKNVTNIRSELRCGALVYIETLVSPELPIFVVN